MTTCKNCGAHFEGKFCNHCGQKNYTDHDRSIAHIFEEAVHFLTHFEGSFFRTIKTIFAHPGRLSKDYSNGKRKQYYKPVSLYFLIVVIYLVFPVFRGLNMEMSVYERLPVSGRFISNQIETKAQKLNLTEEELAHKFHAVSKTVSKILLFLLIPISAFFIYLLFYRKKNYMFDNLILATEINIMYLFAFYIVIPIIYLLVIKLSGAAEVNDEIIGTFMTIMFGIYVGIVFRNIFASRWPFAISKGLVFSFAHIFIALLIYKTLVFETTILLL